MFTTSWQDLATQRVAARQIWRGAVAGAVIATVADALILFIATALFKHELRAPTGPDLSVTAPLSVGTIAATVVVVTLAASLLLWLLGRLARRPFLIFWSAASAVFLLSLIAIFAIPATGETRAALFLMHLLTAFSLTGALTVLAGKRS